jgi:hypothetical protein
LKKPISAKQIQELERICDIELGDQCPARCTSAQYVDKNGTPILFYLGKRLAQKDEKVPVSLGFNQVIPKPPFLAAYH